jgi:F0F1-type ATP synthase assembly protein I
VRACGCGTKGPQAIGEGITITIASPHAALAFRICAYQLLLSLALAGGVWPWLGSQAALSLLLGGLASVVPGTVFAARIFRASADPARFVRAFYLGEVFKFAMGATWFAFALVVVRADMLFLILGYLATVPVYWLALLLGEPQR